MQRIQLGEMPYNILESGLQLNSISFFTTIDNPFHHLEDIFGNLHQKELAIEKFQELKMTASLFYDFYSELIQLVSSIEYT